MALSPPCKPMGITAVATTAARPAEKCGSHLTRRALAMAASKRSRWAPVVAFVEKEM